MLDQRLIGLLAGDSVPDSPHVVAGHGGNAAKEARLHEGGGGYGTPARPVEVHGEWLLLVPLGSNSPRPRYRCRRSPPVVTKVALLNCATTWNWSRLRESPRRLPPGPPSPDRLPDDAGVGPSHRSRVVQPHGVVRMRQRRAVHRHGRRAEELARFEVIDARGQRPSGLTSDFGYRVHRGVLPVGVSALREARNDCFPRHQASGARVARSRATARDNGVGRSRSTEVRVGPDLGSADRATPA